MYKYFKQLDNPKDQILLLHDYDEIVSELKYKIPDAWYMTKNGFLYNTMDSYGHKSSNLMLPFEEIQCNLVNYDDDINRLKNELYNTIQREYVDYNQCKHYLGLYCFYPKELQDKIENKQLHTLIVGIIAAHLDLYEAFNQFYKMDNPMQEYFKMLRLTNFEMDDMFVKFLGMTKLGVSGTKTICTSNSNDAMYREYTKRGYSIDLVNPITVIDNHIEEVDLNYYKTLKKVLDKNFKSARKE